MFENKRDTKYFVYGSGFGFPMGPYNLLVSAECSMNVRVKEIREITYLTTKEIEDLVDKIYIEEVL